MDKTGFIKASNFQAQITAPSRVRDSIVSDLPFLIDEALIPGVTFQTDNVKPKGYGLSEQRPVEIGYEPLTLTIVGDAKGKVQKFLESWRNAVYPINDRNNNERFNYPMDYYGTIELYVYDNAGNQILTYTFEQAYPTNIGAINMGWASTDQLVSIAVQFVYRKWSLDEDGTGRSSVGSQTSNTNRNTNKLATRREIPSVSEYIKRFETI